MSMIKDRVVAPWILAVIAVAGVVILGYFGHRAFAGQSDYAGPPKKVYPGMYNLQAEAAKMRAANEQAAQQNGTTR